MKKIFFGLLLFIGLTINAEAAQTSLELKISQSVLQISAQEAKNLNENTVTYPNVNKMMNVLIEYGIGGIMKAILQDSDNEEKENLAYILYKLDLDEERKAYFNKVKNNEIKGSDGYMASFYTYLIIKVMAISEELDFETTFGTTYNKLYRDIVKSIEMEMFIDQVDIQ